MLSHKHGLLQKRRQTVRRETQGRLNLDELTREECLQLFRFDTKYIQILVNALGISREVRTSNGSTTSGI